MNNTAFYILSFTWGLPLTLVGLLVAAVLALCGYKPYKYGYCYCIEVGENWGGCELGIVFLANKNPAKHTCDHEHGHAIQNTRFGFIMPFAVCLPSAARYWYREYIRRVKGAEAYRALPDYDAIWFEGQATRLGTEFIQWLGKQGGQC